MNVAEVKEEHSPLRSLVESVKYLRQQLLESTRRRELLKLHVDQKIGNQRRSVSKQESAPLNQLCVYFCCQIQCTLQIGFYNS